MKVLIDLDEDILNTVEGFAKNEKRSRKQMLELIIERFVSK